MIFNSNTHKKFFYDSMIECIYMKFQVSNGDNKKEMPNSVRENKVAPHSEGEKMHKVKGLKKNWWKPFAVELQYANLQRKKITVNPKVKLNNRNIILKKKDEWSNCFSI